MKKIKDRPNTPLLQKQILIQERRIVICGMDAWLSHNFKNPELKGSFYSPTIRSKYFNGMDII